MAESDSDDSGHSGIGVASPALQSYGKSLGADLDRHPEMLWLIRQAFSSPLPSGWSEHEHEDASGRIYFYNAVTQESSWTHPRDEVFREIIQLIKAIRKEGLAAERRISRIQEHLDVVQRRAVEALRHWSGPYASEMGQYYHHEPSGASIWDNPVSDWENELALRHRTLCWYLLPDQLRDGMIPQLSAVSQLCEPPKGESESRATGTASAADVCSTPTSPGSHEVKLHTLKAATPAGEPSAPPSPPLSARSFVSARSMRSVRSNRSTTPSRRLSKVSFEHARPPVTAQEAPSVQREEEDPFDFSFGVNGSIPRALPKFGT